MKSTPDYDHDPMWSGTEGEWTSSPYGVYGDRKTGKLFDGDVNYSDEFIRVAGCEPSNSFRDLWDESPEGKRVLYVYDFGDGVLWRLSGNERGYIRDDIAGVYGLKEIAESTDRVWGYGYALLPIEANGPKDAIRKVQRLYKKLEKFDEEYSHNGKVLSDDGPTRWGRNSIRYWQAPSDLDVDTEEGVKCVLDLWQHVEGHGEDWMFRDVWVRITTPDGEEFEDVLGAGEVYYGSKGRPLLVETALGVLAGMKGNIPFPMWEDEDE